MSGRAHDKLKTLRGERAEEERCVRARSNWAAQAEAPRRNNESFGVGMNPSRTRQQLHLPQVMNRLQTDTIHPVPAPNRKSSSARSERSRINSDSTKRHKTRHAYLHIRSTKARPPGHGQPAVPTYASLLLFTAPQPALPCLALLCCLGRMCDVIHAIPFTNHTHPLAVVFTWLHAGAVQSEITENARRICPLFNNA